KAWIYWRNAQMVEIVDRVSKKGNSPYISLGLFFLQHPSVFIYGERYCFLAETGRKTEGCAPGHIGWYSCLLVTDKKPSESEGFLHDPPPAVGCEQTHPPTRSRLHLRCRGPRRGPQRTRRHERLRSNRYRRPGGQSGTVLARCLERPTPEQPRPGVGHRTELHRGPPHRDGQQHRLFARPRPAPVEIDSGPPHGQQRLDRRRPAADHQPWWLPHGGTGPNPAS